MALHTPSRRKVTEPGAIAGPGGLSPSHAVGWLAGGALLTFLVSWVATTLLGLQHDVFYLVYLTLASGYLAYFVVHTHGAWRGSLTRNLWWSLGIGVLVGVAVIRQVMGLVGTAHPGGAFFVFELVWRGVVYGAVDALVLAVFPAVVADAVLRGNRDGVGRKAAFGGLVLVFSLFVSAAYHLGYSTYRGAEMRKPLIGTVMWDLPAVLTGNPAGAVIAHPAVHTAAVVHQYYGGRETNQMLPPELTRSYADRPGGTAALATAAAWLVVTGAAIAYGRRRSGSLPT